MAGSDSHEAEPPRKRQRLSPSHSPPPPPPPTTTTTSTSANDLAETSVAKMNTTFKQTVVSDTGFQPDREAQVGILHYVNSQGVGFTGTLKQRYTDFLVNEIAPDGTTVHLTSDKVPKLKDVIKENEGNASTPLVDSTNGATTNSGPLVAEAPSLAAAAVAPVSALEATKSSESLEEFASGPNKMFIIAPADDDLLETYFGRTLKHELLTFHEKILSKPTAKPSTFGSLLSDPITDRPLRGRLHQDVRRIFESRIETESIEDGKIKLSAAPPVKPHPEAYVRKENPRQQNARGQPKGKLGWQELGGQFLHFSLYKENKDTMEVISYLCRMLKVKPKDFAFAGTKDRRAVTVQRVSVYRQHAKTLEQLNRSLRQARIGDFKHEKHRLELGELQGNLFTITLRDCHFGGDDSKLDGAARVKLANEVVGQAVEHLQAHGFINYFGLQRFGTYGIGTDEIGKKILKNDFEGAVRAILSFNPESLEAANNPELRQRPHRQR